MWSVLTGARRTNSALAAALLTIAFTRSEEGLQGSAGKSSVPQHRAKVMSSVHVRSNNFNASKTLQLQGSLSATNFCTVTDIMSQHRGTRYIGNHLYCIGLPMSCINCMYIRTYILYIWCACQINMYVRISDVHISTHLRTYIVWEARVCAASVSQVCYIRTYARTYVCTYQLLTDCQVPIFKDVPSEG